MTRRTACTSSPTSEAEADTAIRAAAIHWIDKHASRNSSSPTSPASSMTEFQNLSPISADEDQTTNLDLRQAHEESDTYRSTVETAQAVLDRKETVEHPLSATVLPDLSANVDNRRGDDTESVESSSDLTTWTLDKRCGSDESNDAPIEDDRETISDEEHVLRLESISYAKRRGDTWMFKVKYEDSLLAREFFGQLLFSNPKVSKLAMEATFNGVICRVRWRPEWIPIWVPVLTNPYRDLVRQFNALTSVDEEVRWDAGTVAEHPNSDGLRMPLTLKRGISITGLPSPTRKRPKLSVDINCRPLTPDQPPAATSWRPSPPEQMSGKAIESTADTTEGGEANPRTAPPTADVLHLLRITKTHIHNFTGNALLVIEPTNQAKEWLTAQAVEVDQAIDLLEAAVLEERNDSM